MNKAEWDAMEAWEKDELVWATFPEIPAMKEEWVLSTDGGKTAFLAYETETEAKDALLALKDINKTDSRYGAEVSPWRYPHDFTADRNACALVEDEIKQRGFEKPYSILLLMALRGETYLLNAEGAKVQDVFKMDGLRKEVMLLDIRRADPDIICYCALKAVADAG